MNDRDAILSARMRAVRGGSPQPAPVLLATAPLPTPPRKDYLRLEGVAKELDVNVRTVSSWEKQGLRICRIGRIAVVRRVDLDDFLLRHSSVPVDSAQGGLASS